MKTSLKLLAILAIGATAGTAGATVIVYDSFQSYNTGNLIGQAAGGTGLNGSWTNPVADASVTFNVMSSGNMSYTGGNISVSGGSQYGRASSTATVTGNPTANVALGSGLTAAGNGTTYISFLMRYTGTLDVSDQFSLQFANADNDTSALRSGLRDNGSGTDLSFVANNSSAQYPTGGVISGTTYLAVVKLDVSGNNWSSARMWLNPTELTEVAQGTTGTGLLTLNVNTQLNYLGFKFQNPDANDSFDLDEIRIGTTWSDVVIPEPSAWALLAAAGTFFVVFRRRKTNG